MKGIIILFMSLIGFLRLSVSESNSLNKEKICVDGFLDKDEWSSCDSIVGLNAPWTSINCDHTVFKYFHSKNYFYFSFDVLDKTIVTHNFENELSIAKEDRVELFFSPTSDLTQYFCMEIDPKGHILDYSAKFYRKFDEKWNFKQINVAAQYTDKGYSVEGYISLSELKRLKIKKSFYLGIFRADFRSNEKDDVVWYSWGYPKSLNPDFHIPSAFKTFFLTRDISK